MAKTKTLNYEGLNYYHTKLKEYLLSFTDLQFCADELERDSIANPSSEKLYIILSPLSLYVYNDGMWNCLTSQESISDEYIDSLFVADESGNVVNTIAPMSDETVETIWDSI